MLEFDPFSEAFRNDPFPLYRRLREEDPAHYSAKYDTWFLSRFRDVWTIAADGSALTVTEGQMPLQVLGLMERGMMEGFEDGLASLDPPRHTALRKLVSPRFLPGSARNLEAMTRRFVRGFVDEFAGRGEADVIGDLAMRTSVRVASTIIGLPLEKADWCAERVNAVFERDEDGLAPPEHMAGRIEEMHLFLIEQIAERRRSPDDRDDALNALLHAEIDGKKLSDMAVLANISLMLIGGTETLPKAFSAAVNRLGEHPAQRAELVADPSLIPHAFQEALRIDMPTQMLGRRLLKPKELHGRTLEPGQGVLFLWASANRDDREFPDPDRFDIHRRAPRILTFGAGPHSCLGAHMARMEGKVMLEELLARVPEYEVQTDEAVLVCTEVFRGFGRLPIRFAPRA